jgi:hypothetical protein
MTPSPTSHLTGRADSVPVMVSLQVRSCESVLRSYNDSPLSESNSPIRISRLQQVRFLRPIVAIKFCPVMPIDQAKKLTSVIELIKRHEKGSST